MHIERCIAWFDDANPAVQRAHEWAIAWIDERAEQIGTAQTIRVNRSGPSRPRQAR